MEEEKRQKIEKAKKRMEVINKFRLVFLFVAVVLLLFIFWGGKVWADLQWFVDVRQKMYNFLEYDIILLLVMSFAKLFSAMHYNRTVRKL